MPFKSQAQRSKFYELKDQGKMSQQTIDEFEKNTPKNLPERITPPKAQKTPKPPKTMGMINSTPAKPNMAKPIGAIKSSQIFSTNDIRAAAKKKYGF